MKFNYDEITLENIVDNEKNYIFNCDGDKMEITMILKENIDE